MKVTRDKTSSVDLGNGLRLTRSDDMGILLHFETSYGGMSGTKIGRLGEEWANEILAKHFTPVHITLETEDEACTLWHYLNTSRGHIKQYATEDAKPKEWRDGDMFYELNEVYTPKGAE